MRSKLRELQRVSKLAKSFTMHNCCTLREYNSSRLMRRMDVRIPDRLGPYVLGKEIGSGSFSVVTLAYHEELDSVFACKIVPRERLQSPEIRRQFESEISVNQQIHHPGIVELLDLFKDKNNFYLIMEYCPNRDLYRLITADGHMTEAAAKPYVRQILEVIQYYQSMNVSHRDLKPENFLVGDDCRLKLADFGLATFTGPDGMVSTQCGSPCYMSPECLTQERYNGKTTDMWSAGVIAYAMVTGRVPWVSRDQEGVFENIRAGKYHEPTGCSREFQNFIRSILCVDTTRRATVEDALKSDWLRDVPPQYDMSRTIYGAISLRMVDDFFDREVKCPTKMRKLDNKLSKSMIIGFAPTEMALKRRFSHGAKAIAPPQPQTRSTTVIRPRRRVKKRVIRSKVRHSAPVPA